MSQVFLALGTNIDPENNLRAAAGLLRAQWKDIRFSHVYRSSPVGHTDQEDFLNAAATFITDQSPQRIQKTLQGIEKLLGKATPFRFGPRTIDLDILLVDDQVIDTPDLTVPHPRMHERRFVLEPLGELIDPEKRHPSMQKTWREFLEQAKDQLCKITNIEL